MPNYIIPGRKRPCSFHCHPFVTFIELVRIKFNLSTEVLEAKSGICRSTLYNNIHHSTPSITTVEALLQVLGYDLLIKDRASGEIIDVKAFNEAHMATLSIKKAISSLEKRA